MRIEKITIENYKCFFEKQEIKLSSGFNLFIGKNNSGKTTILELLNIPDRISEAHRSEKNITTYNSKPSKPSHYSIQFSTNFSELTRLFGETINLPAPERLDDSNFQMILASLKENKTEIEAKFDLSDNILTLTTKSGFGISVPTQAGTYDHCLQISEATNSRYTVKTPTNIHNIPAFRKTIYRFTALRSPRPQNGMEQEVILRADASNLAFCINHLQTKDSEGHRQLCILLNRIFPEVKWIQSPPVVNQLFELECLPTLPSQRRDDLAISIDKMGTGIGNIVAILYVLLTSRFPQVIAIDEPNSFLHPKALRELLQILDSHGKQHQYILTGHSPDVLTAIEPSTITYFEMENFSSKIKQFNKNQYHEFRSELSDLGIRMTDLHSKDRVLWVEGQTEEIVFPKLLREYCPEISAGTAVLRVTHTGTFESGKVHINEVASTYQRLTQTSLAPPMVAIVLDTEGRKQQDIEKITRENNQLIHFLPYRMIENYVLDADAILAVLKTYQIDASLAAVVSQLPSNENIQNADGAKILKEIFTTSSDATYEFRKTTHTPELFDWLLENKKDSLKPLELFIQSICATTL